MCEFCTILNKELEHLWVLVSVGHPGTDLQQILTDELCVCAGVCVCVRTCVCTPEYILGNSLISRIPQL